MMKVDEARAASEKYEKFKTARAFLVEAEGKLALVNAAIKAKEARYPVVVILKPSDGYNGRREVCVTISLDPGVVQQHCLNEVNKRRREIALLGIEEK